MPRSFFLWSHPAASPERAAAAVLTSASTGAWSAEGLRCNSDSAWDGVESRALWCLPDPPRAFRPRHLWQPGASGPAPFFEPVQNACLISPPPAQCFGPNAWFRAVQSVSLRRPPPAAGPMACTELVQKHSAGKLADRPVPCSDRGKGRPRFFVPASSLCKLSVVAVVVAVVVVAVVLVAVVVVLGHGSSSGSGNSSGSGGSSGTATAASTAIATATTAATATATTTATAAPALCLVS